jgi:hypothetical protein
VILEPLDGIVNTLISVTLYALDQYANINTQENRQITLVTTGSAVGGGVLTFVSGVIRASITDALPETTILTLSDSAHTGVDVSSTQKIVFVVRPSLNLLMVYFMNSCNSDDSLFFFQPMQV